MIRKLLLSFTILAAAGSASAVHAFNPQPDPPAFQALREDIAALPAAQNPQPLTAKVDAASAAIDRGNVCAAANNLDALSQFITVKTGDTIPERNAADLQDDITRIRDANEVSPGPC
jgi:hypothetical protein